MWDCVDEEVQAEGRRRRCDTEAAKDWRRVLESRCLSQRIAGHLLDQRKRISAVPGTFLLFEPLQSQISDGLGNHFARARTERSLARW